VLLIQSGSLMLNIVFCVVTIVAMTASFLVLADMEHPYRGWVNMLCSCLH
jgi:hypothetical protein